MKTVKKICKIVKWIFIAVLILILRRKDREKVFTEWRL